MQAFKGVRTTASVAFGSTRTGKTVTLQILDKDKNVVSANVTIGTVVELSDGSYGADVTFASGFASDFCGYLKWSNTTDSFEVYDPLLVLADYRSDITAIRKIETNRWKIASDVLTIYDDDGTTALYEFNLLKASVANGSEPDERVPA